MERDPSEIIPALEKPLLPLFSTAMPFPTYVYKILPEASPSVLPQTLPLSDLDRKDGFIHLSNAIQVPQTANLFFNENSTLWLLKISTAAVEAEGAKLKWEGPEGCVHLYGAKGGEMGRLGKGLVVDVKDIKRTQGQDWIAATHGENWLE